MARRRHHRDLVARILAAERRVWLTTPYFVPMRSLVRALRLAAWAGRDVRLLLPRRNDLVFMKWLNGAFYAPLLRAGARVYEYEPSVLHAKILLIDGWACVGSSNLNRRSLLHDLEVSVVLASPLSVASIEGRFLEDLRASRRMSIRRWLRRSWLLRLAERVMLRLRHWA